jgi:hypothetical protein
MSLSPEILQERYSAIELAYSERRWPEVESLSQALLAELSPNPADPLQLRLVLLLGHTRLYGLADPSGAHHYYASVLEHCEEPTLRDIAQQGLEQCAQQTNAPAEETAATVAGSATVAQPAAPWLESDERPAQPTAAPNPQLEASSFRGADATPWLSPQEHPPSLEPPVGPDDFAPGPEAGLNQLASTPPLAAEQGMAEQASSPSSVSTTSADRADSTATGSGQPSEPEPVSVLVPEIVDEPEQIAVALADPLQRQEHALEELSHPESGSSTTLPDPEALSAEQIKDLARGLLRIRLG